MSSSYTLPLLVDAASCERLLALETELCEMAGCLMEQGYDAAGSLSAALNAIVLANELLWAHESASPADECLHLAAEQLKVFFLRGLELALKTD